jgi:DNA-binding transcriptional ArsR family regulator
LTSIEEKCFCGSNADKIFILNDKMMHTCGSFDCNNLAKQYGSLTNWLLSNVEEIGKNSLDLDKVELRIVLYLKKCFGANQKTIANQTGLAKSSISKALLKLEKQGLVEKDNFFDEQGNIHIKGKHSSTWRLVEKHTF